jgi:hypothetical protein
MRPNENIVLQLFFVRDADMYLLSIPRKLHQTILRIELDVIGSTL